MTLTQLAVVILGVRIAVDSQTHPGPTAQLIVGVSIALLVLIDVWRRT